MKTKISVKTENISFQIDAEIGEPLKDVLKRLDLHIDLPCGGRGTCKRCIVSICGQEYQICKTSVFDGMEVELLQTEKYEQIIAGTAGAVRNEQRSHGSMFKRYGLSVDIGTTTLCVSLLNVGGKISTITRKNPQTFFGADVISRIEWAQSGKSEELAGCIRSALSEMSEELCLEFHLRPDEIDAAVLTGNSAMLYLLMGYNPDALSHAPFQADRLFGEFVEAEKLNLPFSRQAKVYLPRCVSAFVGADITTAILAADMCQSGKTILLADIGTNGEIVLWHKDRLLCCSTAAGPAFEGVGITCGTYGVRGAIDHIWAEDGHIQRSTIGEAPAVGICGSGIVDAAAVMLKLGIIDETGAFQDTSGTLALDDHIAVYAKDIRQIQLAKGAVRAGIETLLDTAGIRKEVVETFFIAGGFGGYMKLDNAAAIGLIPEELRHCAVLIGNAAHSGATMLLQNKSLVPLSEDIARNADTIRLEANPVFTEHYMTCMMFE